MKYKTREFNLKNLQGISDKQIRVHLDLYDGYVKNTNILQETLDKLAEAEVPPYAMESVRRRLGFEFNGMRMHEYYFEQLEEKTSDARGTALDELVSVKFGDFDKFISNFKEIAMTRGIGWTILYMDRKHKNENDVPEVHIAWVADHELGQLADLQILLVLDMWEHAFMVDYTPAEKSNYIDAFFENLNWNIVEERI